MWTMQRRGLVASLRPRPKNPVSRSMFLATVLLISSRCSKYISLYLLSCKLEWSVENWLFLVQGFRKNQESSNFVALFRDRFSNVHHNFFLTVTFGEWSYWFPVLIVWCLRTSASFYWKRGIAWPTSDAIWHHFWLLLAKISEKRIISHQNAKLSNPNQNYINQNTVWNCQNTRHKKAETRKRSLNHGRHYPRQQDPGAIR